jgi:hypothetical protein
VLGSCPEISPKFSSKFFDFSRRKAWNFYFVFRFLFVLKSKSNRQPCAAKSAKIAGRTAKGKNGRCGVLFTTKFFGFFDICIL